jgi:hypothetical protein
MAGNIPGTGPIFTWRLAKRIKEREKLMSATKRTPLTVLVAEDDADDRGLIKRAWTKNRASNALRFVEDGEELTDYLNHIGKYSDPA